MKTYGSKPLNVYMEFNSVYNFTKIAFHIKNPAAELKVYKQWIMVRCNFDQIVSGHYADVC